MHKSKGPTVLSNLLAMITIPIILRQIYFLTNFRIFLFFNVFFAKNGKIQNFLGFNANGLEIKRRGMTFLILTFIFTMAAKKRNF